MKFRATSVSYEKYSEILGKATIDLQRRLEYCFASKIYDGGFDQLTIVVVCLGNTHAENEKYRIAYTKKGRVKVPGAETAIKNISLGVSMTCDEVDELARHDAAIALGGRLASIFDELAVQTTGGAFYRDFSIDFRICLQAQVADN